MRHADPFTALVDFMAFMVLISVFLFIISQSKVPDRIGSTAETLSFRMTTKAAEDFEYDLWIARPSDIPNKDVEFTLWVVNESGDPQIAEEILDGTVLVKYSNQAAVFGITPKSRPGVFILEVSHLDNLRLVGAHVEVAIDIQAGRDSCSIDWVGRLGIDSGAIISFDDCSAGRNLL